jgi:hypothetical protein
MSSASRERGKEIRKQPAEDGKRQENAKKILNRGNKLRVFLKTKGLAFFGAKNKLKTNPILSAKSANQSEKTRQDSGFRRQDSGNERAGQRGWGLGASGLSKAEVRSVKAQLRTKVRKAEVLAFLCAFRRFA